MVHFEVLTVKETSGGGGSGAGNILCLDLGGDYVGLPKVKIHWVIRL